MYWSFVPTYHFTRFNTKTIAGETNTISALVLSGPDARRPPTYMDSWRKSLNEFSKWVRLNMILSAASYLELYIREIVMVALRSDPLAPLGLPRQLDGIKLLKLNHQLPNDIYINNCASGDWNKRARQINNIFSAGATLNINTLELNKLRRLRNSVGHSFGRKSNIQSNTYGGLAIQSERLAEDRLKKWLKLIEETAIQIDEKLCRNYVGTFEFSLLYHLTRDELRKGKYGKKPVEGALAMMAVEKYNRRVTRNFCKDVIEHYEKC